MRIIEKRLLTWACPPPLGRKSLPEITLRRLGNVPFIQNQPKLVVNIGITLHESIGSMAWRRRLGLPPASSNRNVSEGPTSGPVPLAALAEMPWLINVVVVEVAKLGLHALASRAWYDFIRLFLLISLFSTSLFVFTSFSSFSTSMQRDCCAKQLNPCTVLATLYLSHFKER